MSVQLNQLTLWGGGRRRGAGQGCVRARGCAHEAFLRGRAHQHRRLSRPPGQRRPYPAVLWMIPGFGLTAKIERPGKIERPRFLSFAFCLRMGSRLIRATHTTIPARHGRSPGWVLSGVDPDWTVRQKDAGRLSDRRPRKGTGAVAHPRPAPHTHTQHPTRALHTLGVCHERCVVTPPDYKREYRTPSISGALPMELRARAFHRRRRGGTRQTTCIQPTTHSSRPRTHSSRAVLAGRETTNGCDDQICMGHPTPSMPAVYPWIPVTIQGQTGDSKRGLCIHTLVRLLPGWYSHGMYTACLTGWRVCVLCRGRTRDWRMPCRRRTPSTGAAPPLLVPFLSVATLPLRLVPNTRADKALCTSSLAT